MWRMNSSNKCCFIGCRKTCFYRIWHTAQSDWAFVCVFVCVNSENGIITWIYPFPRVFQKKSFLECCCIFFSFYHVVLLIYGSPSFLSFMPTSPCPTTWASHACSLSWSMRMITGPSSANRCTTSAFQKTQLLVLHCSASWWVPSNTHAEFVVIYSWNSDYNTPISQSLPLGLFYRGCILGLFVSLQCSIRVLIKETQDSLPQKKNSLSMPKLWPGLKALFIAYCNSTFFRRQRMCFTILSLWQTYSCENALMIYL